MNIVNNLKLVAGFTFVYIYIYIYIYIQSNLNSSNTDGSFTMANSNSVLSPYGILPIHQETNI